jgi:hypothetical protein
MTRYPRERLNMRHSISGEPLPVMDCGSRHRKMLGEGRQLNILLLQKGKRCVHAQTMAEKYV